MRKRLAVARFWFEGNAFSSVPTTLSSFRAREWTRGDEALQRARGTESELAAVAEFVDTHAEWDVAVLRCCSANPGGPIVDEAFSAIRDEIVSDVGGKPWDAIYLSLHGAAIARGELAPELALVRAIKRVTASPVGASFDLHANLSPAIAEHLAAASGYRTHPHIDMKATAVRVLDQLRRVVARESVPRVSIHPAGLVLSSFNMRTTAGPMADVLAAARAHEHPPIVEISVFGGFPYADTPDTGASVMVLADDDADDERSRRIAGEIIAVMRSRASAFAPRLVSPEEGLKLALAAPAGLVAVTDPADNPLSGGAADTPALLRALLEAKPAVATVFAYFADEDVVREAHAAGVGARLTVTLGAKRDAAFGPGVTRVVQVVRLTRARFTNQGPMEFGLEVNLGLSAVLDVAGVLVVVTSRIGAANDPGFFAAHGIDLAATRLLCVKAKNHFRAAFDSRCTAIIDVDCPGPASADLSTLPFRHLSI